MKALIIAGGKGTRVRSVSREIPKALFPVRGCPVAEHQVRLLRAAGYTDIIFCLGYLGEQVEAHFGDGAAFGVHCSYVHERVPLGTGGAIRLGARQVGDAKRCLVLYGDIMLEMDLGAMMAFHQAREAVMTFAVHRSDHPQDSSNVLLTEDGRVTSIGRPAHGHPLTGITRTSVQVLERRAWEAIPEGAVSLEDEVVPALMARGESVYGYYTDEFIRDMGTPGRYRGVGGDLKREPEHEQT